MARKKKLSKTILSRELKKAHAKKKGKRLTKAAMSKVMKRAWK